MYGYDYDHGDGQKDQPALWTPQYDPDADGPLLGFRDLIEACIVHALRRSPTGLPTIRLCIERAKEMVGENHPFSTRAFKTDGRKIFLEITKGVDEPRLIDLKDRQHVFRDFCSALLVRPGVVIGLVVESCVGPAHHPCRDANELEINSATIRHHPRTDFKRILNKTCGKCLSLCFCW